MNVETDHAVRGEPLFAGAAAARDGHPDLIAWLFRADAEPHQITLKDVRVAVGADANFVWIDLAHSPEQHMRAVAATLGLDEMAVRLALAPAERPRLEFFDGYFLTTATVALIEDRSYQVQTAQLDLFVGRNFLLSVHRQQLPFARDVLKRAWHNPELLRLDSAFMLYIVLDQLLEWYEDLREHLEIQIERFEERALIDTSDDFLGDLLSFKRYVFMLFRLADQHRIVFAAFLRADFPFGSRDNVQPYYRDLKDSLARLLDTLLAAKEAVNSAFDLYVSQMSHRTNQVMKLLTIVSTTLLPASLILGFFGTSFEGIPLYSVSGFWLMVISIVSLSTIILWVFRCRGWF